MPFRLQSEIAAGFLDDQVLAERGARPSPQKVAAARWMERRDCMGMPDCAGPGARRQAVESPPQGETYQVAESMNTDRPPRGEDVTPRPYELIESIRDFGYTLPTAIADLVDNCI